jgi:hypothetical protein
VVRVGLTEQPRNWLRPVATLSENITIFKKSPLSSRAREMGGEGVVPLCVRIDNLDGWHFFAKRFVDYILNSMAAAKFIVTDLKPKYILVCTLNLV